MANGKGSPEEQAYKKQMLQKLGMRIRHLRELQGETNHEKFAIKHDLNRSQYWRYEKGEDLRFFSLVKILKTLDISLAEFFREGFEENDQ